MPDNLLSINFIWCHFDLVISGFQKNGQGVLVVIIICNYLIFIAVFSGSNIMVATGLIGPLE